MGCGNATAHGFRSSFRDWVSERTGFAGDLAEMQLAHAIESKTEAAYRRNDMLPRRRELMAAWARFCEGLDSGQVVPLRASQ
jgi:integrase